MSRKLEVIIERIKTLNKEELKQLSNEVDAEFIFRNKEWMNDYGISYYTEAEESYKPIESKKNV